jgi:hypothetical protein
MYEEIKEERNKNTMPHILKKFIMRPLALIPGIKP